jgi:RimJ/RimL family protein N-acetyltransferase
MLIGSKVCLGPLFRDDSRAIFNWRNTLELMHLDGVYRPLSQNCFDEWFESIGRDPTRVLFSIRNYGQLDLMGYLQITAIHPIFHSAEIGLLIGDPGNRGRGYGQESLRLAVDFCWKELNLQRLSLTLIGENAAALQAYRRVGFEVEGVMRRASYRDGSFQDVTVLGLLR